MPDLRAELARGPLGGLSSPESGFNFDCADEVWARLDPTSRVALFLAGWPASRRVALRKHVQGARAEYGFVDGFAFGECVRSETWIFVRGRALCLEDARCAGADDERVLKLFSLLRKHVPRLREEHPHSKSLHRWRALLVEHL